jgi:TPR repeat protein
MSIETRYFGAERWYLMATAQNNALAWHNLGTLYFLRLPELEHRWPEAEKCWENAMSLGFDCG